MFVKETPLILEHLLRTNLKDQTTVDLRGNVEVTDVVQDGSGRVHIDVTDRLTGQQETVLAGYLLGCDGANSLVRSAIGSTMQAEFFLKTATLKILESVLDGIAAL